MSLRAAGELAAAGVDIVFLGGVPVNLSRGSENARDLLGTLSAELGIAVYSIVAAQWYAEGWPLAIAEGRRTSARMRTTSGVPSRAYR